MEGAMLGIERLRYAIICNKQLRLRTFFQAVRGSAIPGTGYLRSIMTHFTELK